MVSVINSSYRTSIQRYYSLYPPADANERYVMISVYIYFDNYSPFDIQRMYIICIL